MAGTEHADDLAIDVDSVYQYRQRQLRREMSKRDIDAVIL